MNENFSTRKRPLNSYEFLINKYSRWVFNKAIYLFGVCNEYSLKRKNGTVRMDDLSADERIILKRILRKQSGRL
jgi:hypothetical protein